MKTVKVSKQGGRYYPVSDDGQTIDMRGSGHRTLREVRAAALARGETVRVRLV